MSDRVRLGKSVLTRVVETSFEPSIDMFGATPEEAWAGNADLLVPDFVNLATRGDAFMVDDWLELDAI